jgi:hypothetical protein
MAEGQPITVPIEVSRQDISDLIVSAIEGGCGYWTRCIRRPREVDCREDQPYLGHKIIFVEAVDESNPTDDEEHTLDLTNLTQVMAGLAEMAKIAPRHFGDFIADNADAITADVFIQATLFGEIRYG